MNATGFHRSKRLPARLPLTNLIRPESNPYGYPEWQVKRVKAMYDMGLSFRLISKRTGISRATVASWCKGA